MQQKNSLFVVMDSGLGGLSVVRALRASHPMLPLLYVADTAGFPYGARSADDITQRAFSMLENLLKHHAITTVILACNTLSTLCLAALRAQYPQLQFVGTVPGIKVAGEHSYTRRFTLLATPNTVQSSYTDELIASFAADCVVDRYGAPNLASYAESALLGAPIDAAQWQAELAPCFFDDARGRTDLVILGCTHYPLVLNALRKHAPWRVEWVDTSPAIARQALTFLTEPADSASRAYVTARAHSAEYAPVFAREGFAETSVLL